MLTEYDAQAIYIVGQNYGRSFDTDAPPEVRLQIAEDRRRRADPMVQRHPRIR